MPEQQSSDLSQSLSLYLDLMRIAAATAVFVSHASKDKFGGAWLKPWFANSGAPGVAAFFVLSGFVITWVGTTRERAFLAFIISRLARLWSVVLPAILLSILVEVLVRHLDPALAQQIETDHQTLRYATSVLFLNEAWFKSFDPGTNVPMWSLS